jgi:hypothetical protein
MKTPTCQIAAYSKDAFHWMRPLSKKEGYDQRIPTTMARISQYGTINLIDMSKTESAKFTVSVKTAIKESRGDLLLSTLTAYIAALGGRVHVAVTFSEAG